MKARWDEYRGRILLRDNTDSGAVMLRPFKLQFACGLYFCRIPFHVLT
jgi:hypothetical protein